MRTLGEGSVYAGGAVDYGDPARTHSWRHDLPPDLEVYCPICENVGETDARLIMLRNDLALLTAERCLFVLDGTFTVGTPIEVHRRIEHRTAWTVCIVHPAEPGVFVKEWIRAGAVVVKTMEEAKAWLTQ